MAMSGCCTDGRQTLAGMRHMRPTSASVASRTTWSYLTMPSSALRSRRRRPWTRSSASYWSPPMKPCAAAPPAPLLVLLSVRHHAHEAKLSRRFHFQRNIMISVQILPAGRLHLASYCALRLAATSDTQMVHGRVQHLRTRFYAQERQQRVWRLLWVFRTLSTT